MIKIMSYVVINFILNCQKCHNVNKYLYVSNIVFKPLIKNPTSFPFQYLFKMSLSHFDEKSGIVSSKTEWGIWWQTVSEVTIQVQLETPTKGKEVSVTLKPNQLKCFVRGQKLFEVISTNLQ